ncbi:hypothetical protein HDV00_000177 [Rhizophlyctis rosea]|nr:hypothetical protein HDV00_000177 [Rhizophlyctis rosea]
MSRPPGPRWLYSIAEHSIFKTDADQSSSEHLEETTLPDVSVIAPEPSGHSLDVPGSDLDTELDLKNFSLKDAHVSHRLMAINDGRLFVCVNTTPPQLRVLNLRQWKKVVGESEDVREARRRLKYTVLKAFDYDFTVRQIELNETGKMLAVIGDHDVHVVILPISIRNHERATPVSCKHMNIGPLHHGSNRSARVSKVLWHPLAELNAHLVVLSSDGYLRMYNVAKNPEEPEQVFHFLDSFYDYEAQPQAPIHRPNTFAADAEQREVVSFCFGSGSVSGWELLTAYGVTRSGEVYSICPVMPNRSSFTSEQLDDLQATLQEPADEQDEQTYAGVHAYWRERWVKELLQPESLSGLPGEDVYVANRPTATARLSVERRGPYALHPSVDAKTDTEDASDILSLDVRSLNTLVIAHDSGIIRVCTELDSAEPRWGLQRFELPTKLPQLALHEQLDLNIDSGLQNAGDKVRFDRNTSTLHADPKYPDVFYCYHSVGAHRIDLHAWAETLGSDSLGEAEFTWILHTPSPDANTAVVGFAIINEVYLGYSFIASTSSLQARTHTLPVRLNRLPSTVSRKVNASERSLYEPVLKPPAYEIPAALATAGGSASGRQLSVKLPANIAHKTYPDFINDESLTAFTDQTKAFRKEMTMLFNAGEQLRERFGQQQAEVQKQASCLQLVSNLIKGLKSDNVEARITKAQQKHKFLAAKADLILQILVEQTQPELSQEELKYMEEVKDLNKTYEQTFQPMLNKMRKQKELLKGQRELKKLDDRENPPVQEELGSDQQERISNALEEIYGVLAHNMKQVERLQRMESSIRQRMGLQTPLSP